MQFAQTRHDFHDKTFVWPQNLKNWKSMSRLFSFREYRVKLKIHDMAFSSYKGRSRAYPRRLIMALPILVH